LKGCYIEQLPNWDDIIAVLPRGIRPTDIDGGWEMNGHFIFIEEKSAGKSLENGQRRFLMGLSRQPNTTIAVIRPIIGEPIGMQVLWMPEPNGFQNTTRQEFLDAVRDWGTYADTHEPREWRYTDCSALIL
jgi:hypothetical protein